MFLVRLSSLIHPAESNFNDDRRLKWLSPIVQLPTSSLNMVGAMQNRVNSVDAEMPMPSQAAAPKRAAEGVTTRGRAKAVMPPRAPCTHKSDEIVCSASNKKMQKCGIKSLRDNTMTTIQQRSGKLADNVTFNNALLFKLRERGNVRPFGGGNVILNFGATE